MHKPDKKPELLLPAGRPDAFYAAIEGGADAIYLGLNRFNARGRAKNFSLAQLPALLKLAHQFHVKIYLTLNTVIKNSEIPALIRLLDTLSHLEVDALIIQDWGVYHLIRKHFGNLILHASTQMGNHNSAGVCFSKRVGFERVILARELTEKELRTIQQKSDIGLEIFAHGALCYSFSGMCLMSSFMGGYGANRGLCAQPCRRLFKTRAGQKSLFSLKDNQLIDRVPDLIRLGVDALKIEGRMKSAEYVHTVARAYRLALDHPERIEEAKRMLDNDLGREKTGYFFGGKIGDALSETPTTGRPLGVVDRVDATGFSFNTTYSLETGFRIRVQNQTGATPTTLTLTDFQVDAGRITVASKEATVRIGDTVFLAGRQERKWSSRLPNSPKLKVRPLSNGALRNILSGITVREKTVQQGLFVRIGDLDWLRNIEMETVDGLILNLSQKAWHHLNQDMPLFRKNREKVWIALPKFIPEHRLEFWTHLCREWAGRGVNRFMISHLSQTEILPKGAVVGTSENVYLFNDAAISFMRSRNIDTYVYPFENDLENLYAGKCRGGIIPLYFYPELFFSRMPVVNWKKGDVISDSGKNRFRKIIRDGMTLIIPTHPVALFQERKVLAKAGFRRFLIDLSFESSSRKKWNTLIHHYNSASFLPGSSRFNFRRGLK